MKHKSFFSICLISGVTLIVVSLASFAIVTIMWVHIRNQDAVILDLRTRAMALESRKESDREELRRMSFEELFKRIDDNTVHPILQKWTDLPLDDTENFNSSYSILH